MKKYFNFLNLVKNFLLSYKFLVFIIMVLLISYQIVIGNMAAASVLRMLFPSVILESHNVSFWQFAVNLATFIIIYRLLYFWRNLTCSFWSFMCFSFNILIITLMLGVVIKLFIGINQPIFIENLSHLSTIRHSLFVIFCVLGCIFIFIKNKSVTIQRIYEKLTYPYLLQESKRLLETWEMSFFGSFFEFLLSLIAFNKFKCFLILFLHLFFYYLIPLMQASLFFNFAFFHGDLRLNLYLVPLSLLTVFFKHLWYYFNCFFDQNAQAIKDVLIVKYEDDSALEQNHQFITIDPAKLSFRLSTPNNDASVSFVLLEEYKKYFILLGRAHVHLYYYKKYTKVLSYLIIFLRFISCCNIMFFNIKTTIFSLLAFHCSIVTHNTCDLRKHFSKETKNTLRDTLPQGVHCGIELATHRSIHFPNLQADDQPI